MISTHDEIRSRHSDIHAGPRATHPLAGDERSPPPTTIRHHWSPWPVEHPRRGPKRHATQERRPRPIPCGIKGFPRRTRRGEARTPPRRRLQEGSDTRGRRHRRPRPTTRARLSPGDVPQTPQRPSGTDQATNAIPHANRQPHTPDDLRPRTKLGAGAQFRLPQSHLLARREEENHHPGPPPRHPDATSADEHPRS